MTEVNEAALTWDNLTWQDIQAIGMALAESHPSEPILTLSPQRLARLVTGLPGFSAGTTAPDDFILSAIMTAWISVSEDDDDSSPYDYLA
jgi:FeS assembly protein IscX